MGVVQLDCDLLVELLPWTVGFLEAADNVIQRCSTPEVLLLQTELLTAIQAFQV